MVRRVGSGKWGKLAVGKGNRQRDLNDECWVLNGWKGEVGRKEGNWQMGNRWEGRSGKWEVGSRQLKKWAIGKGK